jgi:hypothetical protein
MQTLIHMTIKALTVAVISYLSKAGVFWRSFVTAAVLVVFVLAIQFFVVAIMVSF